MTAAAAADGRLPPEPPGRPGRAQGLPHAELCPECFAQKLQHRLPLTHAAGVSTLRLRRMRSCPRAPSL